MTPYISVLADPGWEYDQPLKMSDGVKRSSASQYTTMSVQQICDLYQPSKTGPRGELRERGLLAGHPIADIAFLWLWITAPLLLEGIHIRVCNAWGFTPRQIVPWIKGRLDVMKEDVSPAEWRPVPKLVIQPGMGAISRVCVEYLIIATRGKYTQLVKSHSENGLILASEEAFIVAPKSKHSRKPDVAYSLIERLCPGPYLELFARQRRAGWDAWGNELSAGDPMTPAYARPEEGPIFATAQGVHQLQPDHTVKTLSEPIDPDVEIIEWP